jgi:hypothetical protein
MLENHAAHRTRTLNHFLIEIRCAGLVRVLANECDAAFVSRQQLAGGQMEMCRHFPASILPMPPAAFRRAAAPPLKLPPEPKMAPAIFGISSATSSMKRATPNAYAAPAMDAVPMSGYETIVDVNALETSRAMIAATTVYMDAPIMKSSHDMK